MFWDSCIYVLYYFQFWYQSSSFFEYFQGILIYVWIFFKKSLNKYETYLHNFLVLSFSLYATSWIYFYVSVNYLRLEMPTSVLRRATKVAYFSSRVYWSVSNLLYSYPANSEDMSLSRVISPMNCSLTMQSLRTNCSLC